MQAPRFNLSDRPVKKPRRRGRRRGSRRTKKRRVRRKRIIHVNVLIVNVLIFNALKVDCYCRSRPVTGPSELPRSLGQRSL